MSSLFAQSEPGKKSYSLPKDREVFKAFIPDQGKLRQSPLPLPETSELEIMRHLSHLAARNVGIDTTFIPLGSCTMKYNPRCNEQAARIKGFAQTHPLAKSSTVQGNLQLMFELEKKLCQISGMYAGTLQPNAGAQGEFVGVQMINAYHKQSKDHKRTVMLIPDNAHGTNPATAHMCGLTVVTIKSCPNGDLNMDDLKKHLNDNIAGLMLTNPNTLGLFSSNIVEVAQLVHKAGGLLYYDGANLNPLMEIVRPGDMGFDVMHMNLHKTFSTPHGGGGPGSGPVFCNKRLEPFLPVPRVEKRENCYELITDKPWSIGRIASFHGNFGVYLRAYLYIILHGFKGLRKVAERAVIHANYLKSSLSKYFKVPYPQFCMHEFVLQADRFIDQGVRAQDIAKRLLDYGMHAPTIYFPLIVKECMLIEPTETESKKTLDQFVEAISCIVQEIEKDPDFVKKAPYKTAVSRLDEVRAAKQPVFSYFDEAYQSL